MKLHMPRLSTEPAIVDQVELARIAAVGRLSPLRRGELGQYFTPAPLARLMGAMLPANQQHVSLLDAGAGVGSLLCAGIEALVHAPTPPASIQVTAYEVDPVLIPHLRQTVALCRELCEGRSISFRGTVIEDDFIAQAVDQLGAPLFSTGTSTFTAAILNPPYRKLRSDSTHRRLLSLVGIETSNLYTAFLALTVMLLAPQGRIVAVTPRSFCNGPYFRPFRTLLLREMTLQSLHLFESREQAFQEDDVLQENVILVANKGESPAPNVTITVRQAPDDELPQVREVPYAEVVAPNDPEQFIRFVSDGPGQQVADQLRGLPCSLKDLGLSVSTGRVVDFRAASFLRALPEEGTTALIYPTHVGNAAIIWPKPGSKKPNAIRVCDETRSLLVPNEWYVLVKRFSAKEERRRVTASVYDPQLVAAEAVGFENHLNYFHNNGSGLEAEVARGLAAFLNSSLVDTYVRQFNGHTQVNATDLRTLRYPSLGQLQAIGTRIGATLPAQHELDTIIHEELFVTESPTDDPLRKQRRVDEALAALRDLSFPRAQLNERSALTLLALLDLKPDDPWTAASNPLCGITPMMDFFARHYGKLYKPNTRETVRRQTVHQFLDAGLIVANPDEPGRPVNSPRAVYQIEPAALDLLRSYGTSEWSRKFYTYQAEVVSLRERYAQERAMQRIPVQLPSGETLSLSPGGQNPLIKLILDEFAPRFTPGCEVLYLGDTDEKFAYFAEARMRELGVTVDNHGKMPDVVLYHHVKDWLVLIEAVTSHGPIDAKRRADLATLFQKARPGLVYVTAFQTRQAMREYLPVISWETEVWVAESPSHLIHFNGERFLGPYDSAGS
jgi:adenine-specific DNA-methyltransferase